MAFVIVIAGAFFYFDSQGSGNKANSTPTSGKLRSVPPNTTIIFCQKVHISPTKALANIGEYTVPLNATKLYIRVCCSPGHSFNFSSQICTYPINQHNFTNSIGTCTNSYDRGAGAGNNIHIYGIYDVSYNDTSGTGCPLIYITYGTSNIQYATSNTKIAVHAEDSKIGKQNQYHVNNVYCSQNYYNSIQVPFLQDFKKLMQPQQISYPLDLSLASLEVP